MSRRKFLFQLLFVCALMGLTLQPFPALAWAKPHLINASYHAIDTYIEQEMQRLNLPGVSLAIIEGDQIVHLRGFGIADPTGRSMTPQTPMLIGSVSKSFTALAIMQLVEAGKVDLQAPVQQYLPWFSLLPPPGSADDFAAPLPYDPGTITIRHLLSHTSGISRAAGERLLADRDISASALERHVRALSQEHLARPVGSGFEYSNANYDVLGLVVEQVSGKPYAEYIQQHILDPLEMQHSYTNPSEAREPGMAVGYRQWFGFPIPAKDLPYNRGYQPSGYLISSAEDLGHYLIAQANQGSYQDNSVLSPRMMTAMHLPTGPAEPEGYHKKPSGDYANGWYLMDLNGIPVMTHDGDTPDYHADVVLLPSQKMGVALLINTNTVLLGDDIRNLAAGVVSLMVNQQPPHAERNISALFLYISMLAVLIFEMIRLLMLVREGLHPHQLINPVYTRRFWFRKIALPLLIGAAVGIWMFVMMPKMFQVPFAVMLLVQPDLTWVIAIAGGLAILNGLLRSGSNLLRIRQVGSSTATEMNGRSVQH